MEVKIDKEKGDITVIGKNCLGDIEVYLPYEKSCVTCEHFDWWDGDWCCLNKFKILSHSWESGEMGKDLLENIKTPETCEDYVDSEDERPGYWEEYENLLIRMNKK